ncbi:hypothetical protein Ddc_15766 [Ditylenchus destructor]|nr:hypothetical protein Ddc_15766 [Ditylenchus destructor]
METRGEMKRIQPIRMSDVVGMCSFVLRDIFLFCDRRTLIDILPTTRKIRDVISSEFSTTPYLMLRHISIMNG